MRREVFARDLVKIQGVKGNIIARSERIVLVKTQDIFTVWNPEEGFIFTHTFEESEAWEVFKKYVTL